MARSIAVLLAFMAVALAPAIHAAADPWKQGTHYVVLPQAQRTSVPTGKVEVLEVFSYGCIACNSFQPVMEKLKSSLPPTAQMAYLHASFNKSESWPIFQRGFVAAQALGIAERTHQGIFDAIWKTGELAVVDNATHALKNPQPTLSDVARTYERLAGVKAATFLATANSFGVEAKMRAADGQIEAMMIPGTPSLVVNGKYRVNMDSVRSIDELLQLVNYLVAKESGH
ncbi:MAG: thiol:disulfide interchange protein DsbA/DsbL [Gammaproteobacteria bacterium]